MVVTPQGFNGAVLYVRFNISRPDSLLSPHPTAVAPALVKRIMQQALQVSWQPKSTGSEFCFNYGLIRDVVNPIN